MLVFPVTLIRWALEQGDAERKDGIECGYMWTNYHDYTKKSENYCGTNLPGVNVYSRTNKVFGLSLDYAF